MELRNGNRDHHRRTLYTGQLSSLCIQPMLTQQEKSAVGRSILYQLSRKKLPHKYPKFHGKNSFSSMMSFSLVCLFLSNQLKKNIQHIQKFAKDKNKAKNILKPKMDEWSPEAEERNKQYHMGQLCMTNLKSIYYCTLFHIHTHIHTHIHNVLHNRQLYTVN